MLGKQKTRTIPYDLLEYYTLALTESDAHHHPEQNFGSYSQLLEAINSWPCYPGHQGVI